MGTAIVSLIDFSKRTFKAALSFAAWKIRSKFPLCVLSNICIIRMRTFSAEIVRIKARKHPRNDEIIFRINPVPFCKGDSKQMCREHSYGCILGAFYTKRQNIFLIVFLQDLPLKVIINFLFLYTFFILMSL